jgi:heat shock protein HslJ
MEMILKRAAMVLILASAGAIVPAGAGEGGMVTVASVAQGSTVDDALIGTAWLADDIGGRGVVDRVQSTLEFTKPGQIGGLAGCNRYFGPVTLGGDAIAFGNLASTRMMCSDAQMGQEQRFLEALSTAKRLELTHEGQVLRMYAGDGTPVLRFSRIVEK